MHTPLAYDLLTHLWQSTVVAIVLLVLLVGARRLSARTRCCIAWIAVLKFAVPMPWVSAFAERVIGAPKAWAASELLVLAVRLSETSFAAEASPHPASTPAWLWPALAVVWATGGMLLLTLWILRGARARRLMLTQSAPVTESLAKRIVAAAERVGLRTAPRALLVSGATPGVLGVWRPTLIIPRGLGEALAPAELDAILVHECVHVRRRDNALSAIRAAFVAVLWFHPIAWVLGRLLNRETEKACDEHVLEITGDAEAYARGIVASVQHALGVTPRGFAAATTPPVLSRIQAIMTRPARNERVGARWAAIGAAITLVAFSGLAGSITQAAAPAAAAHDSEAASVQNVGGASRPLPEELKQLFVAPPTKPPLQLRHYPPQYPREALAAGKSGRVELELLIDARGVVVDARVVSSTDAVFEPAAREAAKRWPYQPAERNGVPVSAKLNVPVEFEIAPQLGLDPGASKFQHRGVVRTWHDTAAEAKTRELQAIAPTDKPVHQVGKLTIKFIGPSPMSEQAVRELMQIREGGTFDEKILDRDIRALYRTGLVRVVEIKLEKGEGTATHLIVELTAKNTE